MLNSFIEIFCEAVKTWLIILGILYLIAVFNSPVKAGGPFQPCVWPNTCHENK